MRKRRKVTKEIIAEVYADLERNHLGSENAVKRSEFAEAHRLSERKMRYVTHEINNNPEYEGIISTSSALYMCNDKQECLKACGVTYAAAFSLLRKARKMEKKIRANGQFKFDEKDSRYLVSCYFDKKTEGKEDDGENIPATNGDTDE